MKKRKRNYLVIKFVFSSILSCVFMILSLSFASAQDNNKAEKYKKRTLNQPIYAMLVGVSKFKNKNITEIEACKNNVETLEKTLEVYYGFPKENILTLVDEKATKSAIIGGFRSHLIENAKKAKENRKEAVIVYYYCGHGSQYPDQDEDEDEDNKDETFVAYDSRSENVFDILDDEIDDLKAELRAFTTNVTLIMESCHSGTSSRGGLVVQKIDKDNRKRPPYERKFSPTKDSDFLTYVQINASEADRSAIADSKESCKCDKPMSFMTNALIQGLKDAKQNTTYRNLTNKIRSDVKKRNSLQSPQLEGNRDSYLFGGVARRARPHIEIEQIQPDNQIIIRAGAFHGLKVEDKVSIFSSEEIWLMNGVLTKVGNIFSVVELPKNNPKIIEINTSSQVFVSVPIALILDVGEAKTKSHINNGTQLKNDIKDRLKELGFFETEIYEKTTSKLLSKTKKKNQTAIFSLKKGKVKNIFPDTRRLIPISDKNLCVENELKTVLQKNWYPDKEKEVFYLAEATTGGQPLLGKVFDPSDPYVFDDIANTIRNLAYQKKIIDLVQRRIKANLNTRKTEGLADVALADITQQIEIKLQVIPNESFILSCNNGEKKYSININNDELKEIKQNKISVDSFFKLNIENISKKVRRKLLADPNAGGESFYISVMLLTNRGEIKSLRGSRGANEKLQEGNSFNITLKTAEPIGIEKFIIIISKENADFSFYESVEKRINPKSEQKSARSGISLENKTDTWDVIEIDLNITDENKESKEDKNETSEKLE